MSAEVIPFAGKRDKAWETRMASILMQIEDPVARKIVIMAKRQRGELTERQAERLIRLCGVVSA